MIPNHDEHLKDEHLKVTKTVAFYHFDNDPHSIIATNKKSNL